MSENKPSKLMRRTTFQSRLSQKLDKISRKLIDNSIRLSSSIVDMVRVEVKRDERSHDLMYREVTDLEVLPIMLPPLKDVPMRYFSKEGESDIKIPSLYTLGSEGNKAYFEVSCPLECELNEDDLLIRFLEDPSTPSRYYTMILQVKEILGNFSVTGIRYKKYYVTFYDEKLPANLVNTLKEAYDTRSKLGW